MKKPKIQSAAKAIKKAKKSSLARKARVTLEVMQKAKDKIEEMIVEGVVSTEVWLTEEEYLWGAQKAKPMLESLGYTVNFTEVDEEKDEIPDMKISIEHLK